MKKLIIAILINLLLTSCEKEILFEEQSCTANCFYINGVAFDKSTQEKLEGVNIRAYRPGGYLQRDTELVKTSTDKNGEYSFKIPADKFLNRFTSHTFLIEYSKEGYISHYTREEGSTSIKLDSTMIDSTLYVDVELVEKAELLVTYNIASNAENIFRLRTEFSNESLGKYKYSLLGPGAIYAEKKFLVPGNQLTKVVFRLEYENGSEVILEESDEFNFSSRKNNEINVR